MVHRASLFGRVLRPAARPLDLGSPSLSVQAPLARGAAGLRRLARPGDMQPARDPCSEPLERELAVAGLAARLLGHRADARSAACHEAGAPLLAPRGPRGGGGGCPR